MNSDVLLAAAINLCSELFNARGKAEKIIIIIIINNNNEVKRYERVAREMRDECVRKDLRSYSVVARVLK